MTPSVSLIISVYKNTKALLLILKSINSQSFNGSIEVIIAEDNNSDEMKEAIQSFKPNNNITLKHIQQEDLKFRKCKILNSAIRIASSPYLIFIDGDCILHPHFIKSHLKFKKSKQVLFGRRVMLSQSLSDKLISENSLKSLGLINCLIYQCKRIDAALYLPFLKPKNKSGFWGCNWSIHKTDIELVGGFDEQYNEPGIGEDTDINWRLEQCGIYTLQIKNHAIQYHLYHPENYSNTAKMESVLAQKKLAFERENDKKILLGSL
jgi:glycosyltransferase involved in cell wall biosynthesis